MANEVTVKDPTTHSNYTDITTKHLSLEWTVDFDKKYIHGSATHLLIAAADVSEVMYARFLGSYSINLTGGTDSFDTRVLDIQSAEVNGKIVQVCLCLTSRIVFLSAHVRSN